MPSRVITSRDQALGFGAFMAGLKMPLTVSWVLGRDRSNEQNALMWKWAAEVAYQRQDCDSDDVQAEWKLHYGVPILRAADDAFRHEYDATIRPLDYETKVRLMKLGFEVTRKMKVRQMVAFMNAVQTECADRRFVLTAPDPGLAEYNERYGSAT